MNSSLLGSVRVPLLAALLLLFAAPLIAEEKAPAATDSAAPAQVISPEAQAVLDRMTAFLKAQKSFSIDSQATRDNMVDVRLQAADQRARDADYPAVDEAARRCRRR